MKFSVRLSAAFLKRSFSRRIFYDAWKLGIAYLAILVGSFVGYRDPEFRTYAIFGFSLIGLGTALFGAIWIQQSKVIGDWMRRQGDAQVVYSLSEESVETASSVGSSKLRWDAFASLAITEFDTLLKFPRAGVLTLPTEQVTAEAMEYLKERFLAHGKKVEDRRKTANQTPEPTAPSGRGSS